MECGRKHTLPMGEKQQRITNQIRAFSHSKKKKPRGRAVGLLRLRRRLLNQICELRPPPPARRPRPTHPGNFARPPPAAQPTRGQFRRPAAPQPTHYHPLPQHYHPLPQHYHPLPPITTHYHALPPTTTRHYHITTAHYHALPKKQAGTTQSTRIRIPWV
jgi:hypothetical protein